MAEKSTFIKLDRNILNWRWFHKDNYLKTWIYILAKCNVSDHDFEDITVKRGQFVTSYENMSKDLKLSVQTIRTILNRLKSTNELTIKSTNRYTLISVGKYANYQDVLTSKLTSKLTNNQQTTNKQLTNNQQQYKNDKNDKNVRSCSNAQPQPARTEIISYIAENNLNVDADLFYSHYQACGWQTKKGEPITDWRSLLIRWNKTEKKSESESNRADYAAYDLDAFEKYLDEKE